MRQNWRAIENRNKYLGTYNSKYLILIRWRGKVNWTCDQAIIWKDNGPLFSGDSASLQKFQKY